MGVRFVHLHLHSEYSLSDGLIRIPELVEATARAGMPAVALTDLANLFAVVRFYKAALAAGVKPVVGAELWVEEEGEAAPSRLVLLCQDRGGYLRLTRLLTRCYTEGQGRGVPSLRRDWLEEEGTGGLIALSAGPAGDVGQALLAGREDRALELARAWAALFPDRYYLELQRTGRTGEALCLDGSLELAARLGLPVVATNDVRFLAREDFEAHEARVCIHEGRTLDDPRRPRPYSEEQYLRGPEEMAELFADLPEALANSVEIAKRCNLELTLGRPRLPAFPVPRGRSLEEHLEREAREGLERRLAADPEAAGRRPDYEARLARELEVIVSMGFAGYFLIVADFIRWAKAQGIPVGPGRGSGAGSLVAYCLEITDLDPIRYDLLFERFLNPERVSMPDFDVDFCMEGRDRVIDYVVERYGRERVSQIITFGTMAARAVVRDVGRVLGYPYGFVDKIAKLIPFELGMTLDKALDQEEELRRRYEDEEEVRELIDLARKLEGLARNAGKHAGGVVIAPSALTDFTALYCEPGSAVAVTQLDKDDVEAIGLVKFDFLGLRTLTIIDRAVRMVNERRPAGEPPLDIARIPLDDEATFRLLKDCATTAVFQLESQGMKDLIRRLQPDRFEDIVALVALFRPGPLQSGMVDDFINRKHGRVPVEYPHPELEPILAPTYGVILYQEQVMQIAQVLAGYTLGGADLLRRAMGKKKPEEMARQREVFLRGATERGVDPRVAEHIFDLMEKFAGYGFNKSHSAAYALVAYQTAWLKAHHPAAFMAATLTADMLNTDKVVALIDECRRMDLEVLPPDVNRCRTGFALQDERTILYGLGAIKGVGASATEALVAERERGGPFRDLFDLCRRVDPRRVGRRVLEALIRAGALDALGPNRATLMASLDRALQAAEQHHRSREAGQDDLFGPLLAVGEAAATAAASSPAPPAQGAGVYEVVPEWEDEERLRGEKETLGLYLTGHPIARHEDELAQLVDFRLGEAAPVRDRTVVIAGLVVGVRTRASRRGERMAFVTLDDRTGRLEIVVFPETYQQYRQLIVKDALLVAEGTVAVDEYTGGFRMSADRLYDLDGARAAFARRLEIVVDGARAGEGFARALAEALEPHRAGEGQAGCPVALDYRGRGGRARLELGGGWRVRPDGRLLERLRALEGTAGVRLVYAREAAALPAADAGGRMGQNARP